MATRQRAVHRGSERGRRLIIEIGRELRIARRDRGLALRFVGEAVGCSASELSRIERGLIPGVGIALLAMIAAAVGLDLAARCYAGGTPLRDGAHGAELHEFSDDLHPILGWRTEVRVGAAGDQRTWDGMVVGSGWRSGVECEMSPEDWQALERRLELKQRDSGVDFVILLLPDTRHVRELLRATRAEGSARFPVPGRTIMARLRAGQSPGGSGIVVQRHRSRGVASGAPTDTDGPAAASGLAPHDTSNARVVDVPPDATDGARTRRVVTVGAPRATRSGDGSRGRPVKDAADR